MMQGSTVEKQSQSERLVSVDAFRGMTIAAMILVNNPGDWQRTYWPLLHAEWHGCTPTDLVFPFFLFIVGVAIVLALGRRVGTGASKTRLAGKIVKRAAILFALGLFVFGLRSITGPYDTWRFLGVLQRIALCYLVVGLLFLTCSERALRLWTAGLLLGYWFLMTAVPVPGQGAPDLDSKGGHLAGWLDRTILGSHIWSGGKVYDPEGLLSTLPACATTLFGVLAGLLLVSRLSPLEKAVRLFVHGTLLLTLGYVWSWVLPLNKSIWTSSYAVFTAGIATCTLALCFWFFDIRGHRQWARPFVIYGQNAITMFVASGLLARILIRTKFADASWLSIFYNRGFASWLPPYVSSLAHALTWVAVFFALAYWMDRRGWLVKI